MSVTPEFIAGIIFSIMFSGILWMPATWLLLSIFTPKTLLNRYFKEPHFTLTETVMMKMYPGFLIRTGIFGWLLVLPSVDRKRNIKNIRQYMPLWYAIGLRILIFGAVFTLVGMLGLMAFLMLLPESYGPEHVLFTIPIF